MQVFELKAQNGELQIVDLEPDAELKKRIDDLVPEIRIPHFVQDTDIPNYRAKNLIVLDTSSSPLSYSPSRIRTEDGRGVILEACRHRPTSINETRNQNLEFCCRKENTCMRGSGVLRSKGS